MPLRKLSSAIVFVIVVSLGYAPSRGQSNLTRAFYNKPVELKLERSIKKRFRPYYRQPTGAHFIPEGFYPIGWSRDGKFAYYLEPVDEACGCYFAQLFILDLKTDEVLWSFDYSSEGTEEAEQEGKPDSLATLWKANLQLFSDKLREHAIEPQARFSLLSFPVNHKGQLITARLRTAEEKGLTEDERLYGSIGKATLQLNSSRRGKKTVLDHSYSKGRPLYVGMLGYLKSPFEPRIAVVLMKVMRGWEGPPHTGEVQIVGASLENGFRRF
jgi:hypothetical protein